MNAFDYTPRTSCVCGLALGEAREAVHKTYAWGTATFQRCASCGSWCQSPLISDLARWFDSDEYQGSAESPGVAYANYLADEDNRLLESRERCRRDLAALLPPRANVLEVGCATGSLLAAVRELGHDVRGIDLSPRFCETARTLYGLDVIEGDLLNAALPAGTFDAVLAMGTVGNFRDFVACVSRIRELLRPGGVFIFNYPDADSFLVRHVYRDRFWMFTPSIGTFMTTRGCEAALRRSGFTRFSARSDVQRPSLRKLLKHGGAEWLLPALRSTGLENAPVPFAFPVPTVRFATARA